MVMDSSGFLTGGSCCRGGELCSLYNRNPAKLADVLCLKLCAEILFVLLLKFGAVLSIICGYECFFFFMSVSSWRHTLQWTVIMRSILRLLKLRKLVVCKTDLSRGGLTLCHGALDHGLNLHQMYAFNWVRVTSWIIQFFHCEMQHKIVRHHPAASLSPLSELSLSQNQAPSNPVQRCALWV